jgi:hypothetical protein
VSKPVVAWDDIFPSVIVTPFVMWEAHHSCRPTTTWLDGHLVTFSDVVSAGRFALLGDTRGCTSDRVLDIVAIDGTDEDFAHDGFDLPEIRRQARLAWDAGEVVRLTNDDNCVVALAVPVADLTEGDIIAEAVSRFTKEEP